MNPVQKLCEEVSFVSETRVRIRTMEIDGERLQNRFTKSVEGYPAIVGGLAQLVYDEFYCERDPGRGAYAFVEDRILRDEFHLALRRASASRHIWTSGWTQEADQGDKLLLRNRNGAAVLANRDAVRPAADGTMAVKVTPDSVPTQAGWVYFFGETAHPAEAQTTVRLYWNLCAQGAVPFAGTLTRVLNKAEVPFQMKVVEDPQGFRRADGGVLYVPQTSWDALRANLPEIYAQIGPYLKRKTPLFALEMAPGLGLAEDPGNGESFGMSRSRLVAEGLYDALNVGATDADARREAIERRFSRAGLDPARPHLNPGSRAEYVAALPANPILALGDLP